MINEDCKKELVEFLKEYPQPSVVVITTIMDGFVTCIKPIKTICGDEIRCSEKTYRELRKLNLVSAY